MKKITLFTLLILSTNYSISQSITGVELLEKSISFHDPDGKWSTFSGTMDINLIIPKKPNRSSKVSIDLRHSLFKLEVLSGENHTIYQLNDSNCVITRNGKSDFNEEEKKKYRLTCDRAILMKNYYTYLYGLPMKLKDNGTIIHEKVEQRDFKEKTYNVLKVTYDKEVGSDTWYFYFDLTTHAMEVYQFFHDESKNDGEYILLSGLETYHTMKIPKNRSWFYNKDDKNIGEDKLVGISELMR